MNACAWRACSGLSRTMRRTTAFVSIARMPLADIGPYRRFHVAAAPLAAPFGKKRLIHIFRAVSPRAADDDLVTLLVPFQDGARTDAKLLANLRRHGNLPLRGEPRVGNSHV